MYLSFSVHADLSAFIAQGKVVRFVFVIDIYCRVVFPTSSLCGLPTAEQEPFVAADLGHELSVVAGHLAADPWHIDNKGGLLC